MSKIDMMIIGAQKAGTTALKNYLGEHPQIHTHPQMEFTYYTRDEEYEDDFERVFDRYFGEFPGSDERKVVAKGAAMYFNKESMRRLAADFPECKIVLVLREPVERTYSAYQMEVFSGWLKQSISDIIPVMQRNDEQDMFYQSFIIKSLYSVHLPFIYEYFPKEQVRIILYEDLRKDSVAVCRSLYEWLDTDPEFTPDTGKKHNVSRKARSELLSNIISNLKKNDNPVKRLAKAVLPYSTFTRIGNSLVEMNKSSKKMEPLDDHTRQKMKEYFKPYNEKLKELSGVDVDHW